MARYYLTTPIYYVNDVPHLGTAYTTLMADTIARYHRLRGHDTWFLTGTDEHGQKIERAAESKKVPVQGFVDEVSQRFRDAWRALGCTPDDFIRTTEPRHTELVRDLWRKCVASGDVYLSAYEGLYCSGCEGFYTEKELQESPQGLLCPTHQRPVELVKEPSYFFRLSRYQDRLLEFYERNPSFVSPEGRFNEIRSFVKSGLQDLSISRTTFSWGIPVPDDERHVMYVWFDALANYLTALGGEGDARQRFWPCDVHLVGKDILRFHAVYWPAFLMSAGFADEQLPKKIFAHGWLTINGQKMSKSMRNVVEPLALADSFGIDVVRFYLLREIAFGQDGDFSHAQLVARYNAELADTLGNLLNRTLGLCTKLRKAEGAQQVQLDRRAAFSPLESALEQAALAARDGVIGAMDELAPHRAIEALWSFCRAANKYVDEAAPWSAAKKGEEARVDAILGSLLEALRWISVLLWPFMPQASAAIRAQLGLGAIEPTVAAEGPDLLSLTFEDTVSTAALSIGTPIFPKIDADRQVAIFAKLGLPTTTAAEASESVSKAADKAEAAAKKKQGRAPIEPAASVSYEEFARLDLRIGRVTFAERVPKSDKLLRVLVDLGDGSPRQVVAGIGKSWAPEALVGRDVVVVANLAPAKLMGLESRGMILAAAGEGGEADLALLTPSKERAAGTRVK